ncbi:MAG: molybdopterin-synthase adenylyltransferase MoeB [Acidobacteriota bacterium]|nr:molybdopterin-synthase adenylyltransferase MoeB [Acidobacteriota bacterium]
MSSFSDRQVSPLTPEEACRYARHLVLPEVGPEGQAKLKAARVLAVGAGGLGSPLALYLAAAGVGTIGLVDPDAVDASNLHRQVLYGTGDVGRPKVDAAAERLEVANPNVRVVRIPERLRAANAMEIVRGYDVVVDGTDNFPARYIVNDACVLARRPNVWASVYRFEGRASIFWAEKGPCYRCLHPEPPPEGSVPSCAEGGVLGVLPGLLGTVQAIETIKLVLGIGTPLVGRLLLVDALSLEFREVRLRKNPECPVCGSSPTITVPVDVGEACEAPAQRVVSSAAMFGGPPVPEISVDDLKSRRDRGDALVLVDVREPFEHAISDLPGSVKIPMATLPQSLSKLSPEDEIVVYCRTGGRSAQAVGFLRQRGFSKSFNLAGGINLWAERVDPSLPKY